MDGSPEELRADPSALANGAYDAPSKPYKGRKAEAALSGPPTSDRPLAGKPNTHMHACAPKFCSGSLPCLFPMYQDSVSTMSWPSRLCCKLETVCLAGTSAQLVSELCHT